MSTRASEGSDIVGGRHTAESGRGPKPGVVPESQGCPSGFPLDSSKPVFSEGPLWKIAMAAVENVRTLGGHLHSPFRNRSALWFLNFDLPRWDPSPSRDWTEPSSGFWFLNLCCAMREVRRAPPAPSRERKAQERAKRKRGPCAAGGGERESRARSRFACLPIDRSFRVF